MLYKADIERHPYQDGQQKRYSIGLYHITTDNEAEHFSFKSPLLLAKVVLKCGISFYQIYSNTDMRSSKITFSHLTAYLVHVQH